MSGFVSLINIVDKWPIQRDATDLNTLLSPPTRNIFTLTHKIQVGGISQLHQRRDCSWSHGVVHIWDAQILTCCKYVNTNVTNRYCTSYYRLLTLSHLYHDPFTCVRWLIHMCAMTPSYVCHDPFTCVPWLIHLCAMTHSHVCHDSFTCVPWLIHISAMTHSHKCHDSRHMSQNDLPKTTRKRRYGRENTLHTTRQAKSHHSPTGKKRKTPLKHSKCNSLIFQKYS